MRRLRPSLVVLEAALCKRVGPSESLDYLSPKRVVLVLVVLVVVLVVVVLVVLAVRAQTG